jgi:nucleoside-diphosphate-sugar epimerase
MTTIRSGLHVIFGTGALGMAIAHQLVAEGKQVRMVNRSDRSKLPPGVELIIGDAADRNFSQDVCKGAQVVYHCANPRYHFKTWLKEFPPLQQGILAGAISSGAKLIYGDNLYGYGSMESPMREDFPYAATTNKGKMRAELAEILMLADRAGKVRVAITSGRLRQR